MSSTIILNFKLLSWINTGASFNLKSQLKVYAVITNSIIQSVFSLVVIQVQCRRRQKRHLRVRYEAIVDPASRSDSLLLLFLLKLLEKSLYFFVLLLQLSKGNLVSADGAGILLRDPLPDAFLMEEVSFAGQDHDFRLDGSVF